MQAIELQIATDPPLGATLTVPDGATAAALIHQGAGVHDRDGNMHAVGFKSTLYKRVARVFAAQGIATLRFDKRGHDQPAPYPHTYTLPQRVEDARVALNTLRNHERTAHLPTFLVGHSEGGLVAAKLAETEPVPGVVSLCAPAGNVFELGGFRARRVAQQADGAQKAKAELTVEYYDRLEQFFKEGAKLLPEEFVDFAQEYEGSGYAGWESFEWLAGHWADFLKSDPPAHGRRMLVVQGGRDARLYPDNPERWRKWCAERELVEFRLVEHLGHDLNDARQKAFRVEEDVIASVCEWVGELVNKSPER
jgi:pimeloyl-ACP methyl ester carboxylesterase